MLNEIIKAYKSIKTDKDLQKEKLTLCEYRMVGEIIKLKRALVSFIQVANWFKRHGAYVELQSDNVNWLVHIWED